MGAQFVEQFEHRLVDDTREPSAERPVPVTLEEVVDGVAELVGRLPVEQRGQRRSHLGQPDLADRSHVPAQHGSELRPLGQWRVGRDPLLQRVHEEVELHVRGRGNATFCDWRVECQTSVLGR